MRCINGSSIDLYSCSLPALAQLQLTPCIPISASSGTSMLPCLLTSIVPCTGSRSGETSFDIMIADCGVLSKRAAKTGTTAAMHAGTMHQPGGRQSMRSISKSAQHLQSPLRGLPLQQRCAQCYPYLCMSGGAQALARETYQECRNRKFHRCTWAPLRNWIINCRAMHSAMRLAGMLIRLTVIPFGLIFDKLHFPCAGLIMWREVLLEGRQGLFLWQSWQLGSAGTLPAAWRCENEMVAQLRAEPQSSC